MKVLRSWRMKLLVFCAVVLLCLLGFKGLYMDPLSASVEKCRGHACNKPSLQHSNLHRNLFNLRPLSISYRGTVGSAKSASSDQLAHDARPPEVITLPPPSTSPLPKPAKPVVPMSQAHSTNISTSLVPYPPPPPLPPHYSNLTQEQASAVERFVFFIGYGRSGHSIVGSIMDAHPNVIIAHEFYLFDQLPYLMRRNLQITKLNLFDQLYYSSYESASRGWRSTKKTAKGYNLNLQGTWQGQFDRLEVIGDKTGGSTAMLYHNYPSVFKRRLQLLDMITKLPHAAVHVVRNPYDMIATVAMFQASTDVNNVKITASVQDKFKERQFVKMATDIVLDKAEAVAAMIKDCKLDVLEIHLEALIADPRTVIRRICRFLKVPCAEDYIRACSRKLYRKASYSRDLVEWPLSIRTRIDQAIQNFTFFRQYSFEGR